MANLITSVPAIATTQWDVYFKPLLDDPSIQALPFDLSIGVMPREIFFNTNVDKITGAKSSCAPGFKGTMSTFSKKTLTPIELQANVEQCYEVVLKKLFGDKLPNGWKKRDITPEVVGFLVEQQKYAFNRDLLSLLFLGDTAATPDDYYSLLDGVYKRLKTGATAVDGTVNAGAIVAANLSTANFFTTMSGIYDLQSRQLKNIANDKKIWIWTQAVMDKYLNYLEVTTQNTAGAIQTQYVTDGMMVTTFKGIKIFVPKIVDERLETDFLSGSPSLPTNPYRVILTDPTNHRLLMDGNGFAEADVYTDKPTGKVFAEGSCLIDYNYGYGDLNVYAGF